MESSMHIRTASRLGKATALISILFCAGMFTGCGGFFSAITTTTTNNTGTGFDLVYAGKNSSNSFVGYAITSSGLTAVTGSPFSLSSPPLSMAITPADTFLYVGTATAIYGYSIAAGGALTVLNGGSPVANAPSSLAPVSAMDISPDGGWLVVTNTTGGVNALAYQIAPATGLLTAINNLVLPIAFPNANATEITNASTAIAQFVKFSPDEKTQTPSVIAASFGTGGEWTFTFNSTTGGITFADYEQPTTTGVSDNGVAWSSNSSTLYFTRGGGASALVSYPVSTTNGMYQSTAVLGPVPDTNPTALSFNANQNYLYLTSAPSPTSTGLVDGYSITTSGSSTAYSVLSGSPYSTSGIGADAIAFDNSDTYMLVMNQSGPPDLIQYTIDGVSDPTTTTLGRLYVNSSANTGLTATSGIGPGITMVTTH
jgi:6-phosphogluconolactonase